MTTSTLFERQMAMYATYHRDARNRLTHVFGIPAIILAVMVALATLRLPPDGTLSLAIVVAIAVAALWIALDAGIGVAMAAALVPGLVFAEWLVAAAAPAAVWAVFGLLFVGGWALQLWGHAMEGRRPALVSNLFQALIGPMFLMAELAFALGRRRGLQRRVAALVAAREGGGGTAAPGATPSAP